MNRRFFAATSIVVLLGTAAPVFSAPKRDSDDPRFIDRVILKVKRIITTVLDLTDPLPPRP